MLVATLILQAPGQTAPAPPLSGDGVGGLPVAEANDFHVFWKDGIKLETTDGSVKARLGGFFQEDFAYVGNNKDLMRALGTPMEDGTSFRRARIYAGAVVNDHLEFMAMYDFAPAGVTTFRDVYAGLLSTPWGGNLRVGQFKEPFGLDELTSDLYNTFMERGLPDVFAPARNVGAMQYNSFLDDYMTYAVGLFKDTNAQGARFSDGEWNVTGRLTGTPVYEDNGMEVVHLGVDVSVRKPNDHVVGISATPESFIAPTFVSASVTADDQLLVGGEAGLVWHGFALSGEYYMNRIDQWTGPNVSFNGYYVEGSYFLTGEHRGYDRKRGVFDRVRPASPAYGSGGGCGAWQLKARWSALDLNDENISGGKLQDVTVGVNWYLTSNMRLMLEGINADLDNVDSTQIVQARIQVDW